MRVVIDTCVWVSALISKSPKGAPRKILNKLERGRLRPVISPRLLEELSTTLARKKFRKAISAENAADFISELSRQGEMVPDVENPPVCYA
ncbi:MAG: putative toxin-antitoxin system toxin component, PIN family [Terriglobales bacterium]